MSEKYKRDELGNRMKVYEHVANKDALIPNLPVIVRLDGNNFSKFTKNLNKPYDVNFTKLMQLTTEFLVSLFSKCYLGYTQSDEITLVFYNNYQDPLEFSGRIQKLCSIIASKCTCFFALNASKYLPPNFEGMDTYPVFDCRIWNVPNWIEASNTILWREVDATKNSIQTAAQTHLPKNRVQGIKNNEVQKILLEEADINWNDYPNSFKKGTYFIRYKNSETGRHTVMEQDEIPPLMSLDLKTRLEYLFPIIQEGL